MKGLIMAAGKGSRLYPATIPVDKALVPIYDKPLIYYPMETMIYAGIRDIMIIVGSGKTERFYGLFGDGSDLGMSIQYREQPARRGIADAFLIAEDFIGNDLVCLMLGDNIFIGGMASHLKLACRNPKGATIFAIPSQHPERYGVVWIDDFGCATSIEEKPTQTPTSNLVVPGAYVYDNMACELAKTLKPSARGELEITDLNRLYLEAGMLNVRMLERNSNVWMDIGNAEDMVNASVTIRSLYRDYSMCNGYVEVAAFCNGWIDIMQLHSLAEKYLGTQYGDYLMNL